MHNVSYKKCRSTKENETKSRTVKVNQKFSDHKSKVIQYFFCRIQLRNYFQTIVPTFWVIGVKSVINIK